MHECVYIGRMEFKCRVHESTLVEFEPMKIFGYLHYNLMIYILWSNTFSLYVERFDIHNRSNQ